MDLDKLVTNKIESQTKPFNVYLLEDSEGNRELAFHIEPRQPGTYTKYLGFFELNDDQIKYGVWNALTNTIEIDWSRKNYEETKIALESYNKWVEKDLERINELYNNTKKKLETFIEFEKSKIKFLLTNGFKSDITGEEYIYDTSLEHQQNLIDSIELSFLKGSAKLKVFDKNGKNYIEHTHEQIKDLYREWISFKTNLLERNNRLNEYLKRINEEEPSDDLKKEILEFIKIEEKFFHEYPKIKEFEDRLLQERYNRDKKSSE